ncbi:MAG TPA: DUF2384 domain-containing protein [Chromatiales bacterium]|nr:DUF2384 domain-containing protein [Chromatiales bacterium]
MAHARQFLDENGFVNPRRLAESLHTTVKEVAELSGLPVEAVSKRQRLHSKRAQKRLRDMVMVLNRVEPWCGSLFQAYAWYRSEPIPSLGDATAEDLVKAGKADLVLRHLGRIAQGGYA